MFCSLHSATVQMKNSKRSATAINPVTMKYMDDSCAPTSYQFQIITDSKVKWPLRFTFTYFQPVTQHYKRRTVLEAPLQNMENSCLQA